MVKFFTNKLALAPLALALLPSLHAVQIPVTVGGPGLIKYNPEFVTANPGDVVVFTFKQKNHTLTQSTFQNPCQALPGGFDSGFVPVADNNANGPFPQAEYTVKDTNPVFAYCRQGNHCQQGMVFAINPGTQFDAFKAAAMGNAVSATAPPAASTSPAASPSVVTVTATVTVGGSPVVTTYGSYPGSAAPTAGVSTDHKVIVGGPNKLIFDPANITAQVGDTITFQFMQKNHTVTQSSFANPCTSLTQTSTSGQVAFDSGFMPVADGATTFPSFTIQINDTSPIWAFCRQANHCVQGMVFAANAVESGPNTFEAFLQKAKSGASPSGSSAAPSATTSGRVNSATNVQVGRGAGLASVLVGLVLGVWL